MYYLNQNLDEIPESFTCILSQIDKASSLLNGSKSQEDRALIMGEIGFLYLLINELSLAETYIQKSLSIIEKNDLSLNLFIQNGLKLAHVWKNKFHFEQSIKLLKDLIEASKLEQENQHFISYANFLLGQIYFTQKDFKKALEYFDFSLKNVLTFPSMKERIYFAKEITLNQIVN